jgi:hypothetical protein
VFFLNLHSSGLMAFLIPWPEGPTGHMDESPFPRSYSSMSNDFSTSRENSNKTSGVTLEHKYSESKM